MLFQNKNVWIILSCIGGLALTGCGKEPGETSPAKPGQPTMEQTPESSQPAKAEPMPANPTETQPAATEPAPVATQEERKELKLELPDAVFVGTPSDLSSIENLEPKGTKRPPFLAPADVTNLAKGLYPASTDNDPIIGDLEMITDGDKEATDGSYIEMSYGLQHITFDLGAPKEIYAIVVWHYHSAPRVYKDVIVQIADDQDFTQNVRTLFNNDHDNSAGLGVGKDFQYIDSNEGRLVDAKGSIARFIRLYSNGNSENDQNHYIEVEIYGRPAK